MKGLVTPLFLPLKKSKMNIIPQKVITDYLSTPAKTYEGMANIAQSIFEASNQLAKEPNPSLDVANGILANSNYLAIIVARVSQLAFFNTQLLAIQASRKLDEKIFTDGAAIKH